ncbi:MAG: TlpA family protein disulfide reductase [Planctomycetota bacterium]|jgi:peroxiredoxin
MRWLILSCLLLGSLFIVACSPAESPSASKDEASSPAQDTLTRVGQIVPEFSLTTLDGRIISPEKMKGKVLLLNFFATWCPPCNKEMPHLEKEVWQRFKDEAFMLVAVGREHNEEELAVFKKEKEVSFPFAPDPERMVYSKFATQFIPRNVVIDREGRIIFQSKGFNEEEFEEMIELIDQTIEAVL